jgi:type II secretory pathway pseudopilin PulG
LTRTFQNYGDYPSFGSLPAFPPSRLRSPRAAARGYTLAALMIFVTVLMIFLAAGFQLWSNRIQRENEEELIFRGKQYVEAIRLYQQRWGKPPTKLKELMDTGPGKRRCIRQLWKDPITNSDKWGLIFNGGVRWPVVAVPGALEGEEGGAAPGQPVLPGQPPGGTGMGSLPASTIEIKPFETSGADGEAPAGPIIGVFSTSTRESLRAYNGRRHYCEWDFSPQVMGQGGVPGAGGQGGKPMGGQPGGAEGGGKKP